MSRDIFRPGPVERGVFDVLCNVAYSAPLRTRRDRAECVRREKKDFFERYTEPARQVLNDIFEKYIEYGTAESKIPDILKVPPISQRGPVLEISALFSGAENLRGAVSEMQTLLHARQSWSAAAKLAKLPLSWRLVISPDLGHSLRYVAFKAVPAATAIQGGLCPQLT